MDDTVKFKSPRNPSDIKKPRAQDPFDQNDYVTSKPSAISRKQPQYEYRQNSGSEGKALISPAGSLSVKKKLPNVKYEPNEFQVPRVKEPTMPKVKYEQEIPEVNIDYQKPNI